MALHNEAAFMRANMNALKMAGLALIAAGILGLVVRQLQLHQGGGLRTLKSR
jgi:multidrug transporter EmrE-like cation transporter